MKRTLTALVSIILLAAFAIGQQTPVPFPAVAASYAAGIAYAPNFGKWQIPLGGTVTATGSQSFLLQSAFASTPDGIVFVPFVVNGKITVGTGAQAETVTISAVSGCSGVANYGQTATCTVTATSFANNHYIGEPVTSADNGIMEARSYASNTGGGLVRFDVDCGVITLATGSQTTTSTCYVPNLIINQGSASRVTTTITSSATGWEVGVTGALATFSTNNTTLTAGTTAFTTQGSPAVALVTSATSADLAAVILTAAGGNPGAGAIHVRVWGFTPAQSAF